MNTNSIECDIWWWTDELFSPQNVYTNHITANFHVGRRQIIIKQK